MVLFQLEESLGSYVAKHGRDDLLRDVTSDQAPPLRTVSDIIEASYLDEIFRFSLDISKETNDYTHLVNLYNSFKEFGLFEVRNSLAHPNRIFNDHYWYKVASVASHPSIVALKFEDVTGALISAENEQLIDPPSEWLKKYNFQIPNNLPEQVEHSITGLVGRNKEITKLTTHLKNERISVTAIVAPGGMGKTALALEILSNVVSNPKNSDWCDGVFFTSMKTEKLTSDGIVKLTASETLEDIKSDLLSSINDCMDHEFLSFDEATFNLKDKKILLFLDNLETLLRDDQDSFEELNESLPRNWQVLITSRITVPHKVVPLNELAEGASIELAKRYIHSRGMVTINHIDLQNICKQCFYNPLAIRLTLDLIGKGGEVPDSISIAQRDISEFSFSNLVECLSESELRVLECIFIEHKSTRQSIHSLLNSNFDEIASSISHLSKTSLIERNISGDKEDYTLTSSVRELLLRSPKDLCLRSEIHERHTNIVGMEKVIDLNQKETNSKPFHATYIPLNVSKDLKVLTTRLFKMLKIKPYQVDVILGRSRVESFELSKIYKDFIDSNSALESFALYHRCIAIILAHLRDMKAARLALEKAINIDSGDYISSLFLGRLLMEQSDYHMANQVYTNLMSKLDPEETADENYSRCIYNGYFLSLLYQQRYEDILSKTKDWKKITHGQSNLGLIRATAHKRLAENALRDRDFDNFLIKINSASGILSQIFRDHGYFRTVIDNAIKLIEEASIGITKISTQDVYNKKILTILDFSAEHIPKISNLIDDRYELNINQSIARFIDLNIDNNPFHDRSWSIFISQSDPGMISEEEAINNSYIIASIDTIIKPKGILFSFDENGNRYFSHVSSYQGNNNDDWYNLSTNSRIAIKPNYNCRGELPVSTEMYILETR
ncbi:tetratricopeptide repeat protein [Vibrio cholerae]|uniref:tetratricopeptide repeat protein n=1 Tax=Vibrio cholerae TaxID=666 RepID=UPI0033657218